MKPLRLEVPAELMREGGFQGLSRGCLVGHQSAVQSNTLPSGYCLRKCFTRSWHSLMYSLYRVQSTDEPGESWAEHVCHHDSVMGRHGCVQSSGDFSPHAHEGNAGPEPATSCHVTTATTGIRILARYVCHVSSMTGLMIADFPGTCVT